MKYEVNVTYPYSDMPYLVRVSHTNIEMWDWCGEHCEPGTWRELFGFSGLNSVFCFDNEASAMLFLIRWSNCDS